MEDSWGAFKAWMRRAMAEWGISNRALAARMSLDRPLDREVSEDVVSYWRRGRSRPQLWELPQIVRALNALRQQDRPEDPKLLDVQSLLRDMGALDAEPADAELFDTALRLQKLQLKLRDANYQAATQGSLYGASRIVQAAVDGGKWAVAVWPSYEGPTPSTRIHVSDRIDFRRTDDYSEASNDTVWADESMKAALRAAHAVPSRARPRWNMTSDDAPGGAGWSVLHIGVPRDPVVQSPWPGLPGGLCFIAVTSDSWVTDIADLTALMIGYGLTTTTDLAMEIFGQAGVAAPRRWRYHEQLLRDPPRRDVWVHHGTIPRTDTRRSP